MLQAEKPNTPALAASTHNASGGLSTDTSPPGSNETKKKLLQLPSMLRTAAE